MLVLLLASSLAGEPAPLHPLCTFTDARWEHDAELWIPGTTIAVASAYGWAGDPGGPRVDATLGERAPWSPVLAVEIRGGGSVARGEVAPGDRFRVTDGASLGPAGSLLPGATVTVVGGGVTGLRVRPADDDVRFPFGTGFAEVPCSTVSLHAEPGYVSETEWWTRTGLPADAPEVRLRAKGAPLRDGADGPTVARVSRRDHPQRVRELGRRDGFVEVAWTTWRGTLYRGFVREGAIEDGEPDPGGLSGILGMLGAHDGGREARACDVDLPVAVNASGRTYDVGTLGAGVPFEIVGATDGATRIVPRDGWLHPLPGQAFATPVDVRACPVVEIDR